MDIIEYWQIFLRRKWIIITCTFLFAILGAFYAFYKTPVYQANLKLLVIDDQSVGFGDLGGLNNSMLLAAIGKKSDPLETQIQLLNTRPIMQAVIDSLKLVNLDDSKIEAEKFAQGFSFEVILNTNLIHVQYKDQDSTKAAQILNTLGHIYIEKNQELNREAAHTTRKFIEEQLLHQKSILDSNEARVVDYKKRTGALELGKETEIKVNQIADLQSQLIQVEGQLEGVNAQQKTTEAKLIAEGSKNSTMYSLWRNTLEEIQSKQTNIKAQRKILIDKLALLNKDMVFLPQQELDMANLLRDKEIAKTVYTQLLQLHQQTKIREAGDISNIKVVEPAIVPSKPVEPIKRKVLTLALIIGFILGFLIAIALEFLDDSPRSIEDVRKILGVPVLGAVPLISKQSILYARDSKNSTQAEALRLVHSNLKFSGVMNKKGASLMISSSKPEEGKSTTSLNLAVTYAELGQKVCIVGLDLRRPSLHNILEMKFSSGLTHFLIGEASIEDISYHVGIDNLTIIPSGIVPPNPTALLSSNKMHDFMEDLKTKFDIIIYDTPPMPMVAETINLALHVDGILLIVGSEDGSTRALRSLTHILDGKNLPVLGFVMNKVGAVSSHYYGSYYGYYSPQEEA